MKLRLIAAAAFLASSSTFALAADPAAVVEEIPTGFNWTGGYIGAQIGYAWGDSTYSEPDYADYFGYYDPDGFLGGFYAGYNYQMDNKLVVGVDADFAFANVDGDSLYYSSGDPWDDTFGNADMKWSGALRARLGYAFDRFMPYVAGGLAIARYEYDFWQDEGGGDFDGFNASKTMTGWTLGVGGEYAATDNIVLRAEYRYSDFGSNTVDGDATESWYTNDVDLKTHDIRLGVAYKF